MEPKKEAKILNKALAGIKVKGQIPLDKKEPVLISSFEPTRAELQDKLTRIEDLVNLPFEWEAKDLIEKIKNVLSI